VSTRPRAWSKSELQDLLWPDTTVVEANLPNLVAEVRSVLDDDPQRPQYLRTIHRYGYGFVPALPPSAAARRPSSVIAEAGPFIGRSSELSQLEQDWERVRAGKRVATFVAGEPGIGKTRLLQEFAGRCLEAGARVLFGHCDEEALASYQPFVEVLGQLIEESTDAELDRQVSEGGLTVELARLLPALAVRFPDLGNSVVVDSESERFHLFQAVDRLLSRSSARTPAVIVIDDLHWAGRSSLLMLRHLARGAPANPIFLIGSYRDVGLEFTPLGALLADLRRDRNGTRLTLRGLQADDVGQLVRVITGRQPVQSFMKTLTSETSGNPFFIREILHALRDAGDLSRVDGTGTLSRVASLKIPDSVKEVISQRVARLSEQCKRALSLAAVLGRDFRFEVLTQVGRFNQDELLDVLEAARAAGVIVEVPDVPGRFSFSHALVRKTLYEKLSRARRIRLHLQIAEVLERLSCSCPIPLADLAYHFVQAASESGPERAIDYATRAAQEAAATLAHEEAARFYEMALEALGVSSHATGTDDIRADLHAKRGEALASVGNWPEAKAAFATAVHHLGTDRVERRVELLLKLAMANFWVLDIAALRPLVTEALRLAEGVGRQDLAGEALGWLGRAEQADGNLNAAIEIDCKAFARTGAVASGALVHAPLTLYLAGKFPDALKLATTVLADARKSGESSAIIYALSHHGLALAGSGLYAEAAATFGEAREFAKSSGAYPLLARARAMAAGWRLDVFDFRTAQALQCEAREIAREAAFVPSQVSAGIDLLLTLCSTGRSGTCGAATARG
jgi:tetratricopeptide (TPR) repeat protein